MSKLMDASYSEIFPENLKKYKNLLAFSENIEYAFKKNIIGKIKNLLIFYNLELEDEEILDEIAWSLNIDNYKADFKRDIKIELIKTAYWVHSKKGTKKAVEAQLKTLNYPIKIEEWFEYGGKPFTFRLSTKDLKKDKNWLKEVMYLIEEYKNVRSILEAFVILKENEFFFRIAGYKETRIVSKKINANKDREIRGNIYIAVYRIIKKETRK